MSQKRNSQEYLTNTQDVVVDSAINRGVSWGSSPNSDQDDHRSEWKGTEENQEQWRFIIA